MEFGISFCPSSARLSTVFLPQTLTSAMLLLALLSQIVVAEAAPEPINRRDGFLLIWNSVLRPSEATREKRYTDVRPGDPGEREITFAKARGILNDGNEKFEPNEPLAPVDALLMLFRTRSVERLKEDGTTDFMTLPEPNDVPPLAAKYGIDYQRESTSMTREELMALMRELDSKLAEEEHEVSLYAEKFHGRGTAFGEAFDMNALTAAHRTYPYHTLVRVTNAANGKSTVVRINDRGPFVAGRAMDLSLRSFTEIADRASGKIQARFERLGDSTLVRHCHDDRFQRRITKDVRLSPGIPHSFPLGSTLSLTSDQPFVLRELTYPDGTSAGVQTWITTGETYEFAPSIVGTYRFLMGTTIGRQREMTMEVAVSPLRHQISFPCIP